MTSQPAYTSVVLDLGVDFTLPILRTGVSVSGKDHIGMVVHRQFLDVCFTDRVLLQQFPLSHGTVSDLTYLSVECVFYYCFSGECFAHTSA